MKRLVQGIALAAICVSSMGASCFDVTDPLELSVNSSFSSTYNIATGATVFGAPLSCATKSASDYADTDYEIVAARISDVTIRTVGSFTGNITNGSITVNGSPLIAYSGPWNSFNTEQSLLTSTLIQRNQAGLTAIATAMNSRQPLVICATGQFSSAVPAGLQVVVGVQGQLDVRP